MSGGGVLGAALQPSPVTLHHTAVLEAKRGVAFLATGCVSGLTIFVSIFS